MTYPRTGWSRPPISSSSASARSRAQSGPEALALLEREPVDLVLLDMNMPGMDGLETLRRIRAMPGPAASLPVVAMTADATEEQRDMYLGAGLTGYVAKPVTPDRMSAELSRVLGLAHPDES